MRELLSVIVPCYNEGAVIERTAKAIVDTCTGRAFDFEIIFVNDGSKDDTLAFLKKLAGRSEKIKYISFIFVISPAPVTFLFAYFALNALNSLIHI